MSDDLDARARTILDANRYLTLATADAAGRPWATPVFYAVSDYTDFYWMSAPGTTHSRNIAVRPEVGAVVFDSTQRPGTGSAVYLTATAAELAGDDVARGLAVYPGGPERGGRRVGPDEVRAPGRYRLYRARVTEHWMVCPWESGPCPEHGPASDHRTRVHPAGPGGITPPS